MRLAVTKLMVLLVAIAALTMAVIWSSGFKPAAAQGLPCGHDYCDWYRICHWEYWAWDSRVGWTLVDADGQC
jgi:hypothetical protein